MDRWLNAVGRLRARLIVLVTGLVAAASPIAVHAEAIGFVDRAFAIEGERLRNVAPWSQVAHIERNAKRVERPGPRASLEPGDTLVVDRPGFVVFVHKFADNTLVPVRKGTSWEARGQSLRGLAGAVLAWIEDQLSGPDQHRITSNGLATLGTRGGGDATACYNDRATDQPTGFAMPIFAASQSAIDSRHRVLVVPWSGGATPFAVRLTDAANGVVVATLSPVVGTCVARLETPGLRPGRFRISVADAKGAVMEEGNVLVGDAPPPMPDPLKAAALPDIDRQLYYATWLASIDEGKWAFEALQQVAAMDCRSASVQAWLERWGAFSCAK